MLCDPRPFIFEEAVESEEDDDDGKWKLFQNVPPPPPTVLLAPLPPSTLPCMLFEPMRSTLSAFPEGPEPVMVLIMFLESVVRMSSRLDREDVSSWHV
jgi:hypothetical protein